jgi:hypothetical protein
MRSGEEITLGSARLTVLSPRREVVARASRGKSVDLNALSAALTITWKAVRVVLGADLPATEWGKVVREDEAARPGEHIGLKIPHHGSAAAQHAVLAHPNDGRTRTWAVTPWNRGATLPRFEDEEGIALLLTRVREVHLTSLPVELRPPLGSRQVTRTEVARRIARRRFGGDDIVVEYDAPTPSAATSWVLASFDEDGTLTDIRLGPNAVTIM